MEVSDYSDVQSVMSLMMSTPTSRYLQEAIILPVFYLVPSLTLHGLSHEMTRGFKTFPTFFMVRTHSAPLSRVSTKYIARQPYSTMPAREAAWVRLMVLIYTRDPLTLSDVLLNLRLETLLSDSWLCAQLTMMANNTNSLSSSHCGPSDNGQGQFSRRTKPGLLLSQKCVGPFRNFNILESPAPSIASLITQFRLEKCCWSEIEYIRNPINDFGRWLAGLVSPVRI